VPGDELFVENQPSAAPAPTTAITMITMTTTATIAIRFDDCFGRWLLSEALPPLGVLGLGVGFVPLALFALIRLFLPVVLRYLGRGRSEARLSEASVGRTVTRSDGGTASWAMSWA
jgi:hypothetical protein